MNFYDIESNDLDIHEGGFDSECFQENQGLDLTEAESEILDADVERSITVICEAWGGDESISYDEMANHLEALIDVLDRKLTFSDFTKKTRLTNSNYLN